jgi:hypothetical protein
MVLVPCVMEAMPNRPPVHAPAASFNVAAVDESVAASIAAPF